MNEGHNIICLYKLFTGAKANVYGAINMLGCAKRLNAKIFQASTSEAYRDPEVHPQKENFWGHVPRQSRQLREISYQGTAKTRFQRIAFGKSRAALTQELPGWQLEIGPEGRLGPTVECFRQAITG
jgi:hypothetical protein